MSINWRSVMWVLYDQAFNGQTRTETFAKLRELGLSRRQAAKEIQYIEREEP
jgi:hypothetical protein